MKPLSTAWTQHLTGQEKEDFEKIVRNSTLLLTRLKAIIEEREKTLLNQSYSTSDFEEPNWSHKQAFRNGLLSELRRFKEFIPF